jgi:hypothetical protein
VSSGGVYAAAGVTWADADPPISINKATIEIREQSTKSLPNLRSSPDAIRPQNKV